MKFIYACDIHGDIGKYEQLYKTLKETNINTLVLGGDLLPKKADLRAPIQRRFINGYFNEYMKKLNSEKIRFVGILGNDDLESIEPDYINMISKYENIYNVDGKKIDIDGISFIGLSKVLDTPFFRKDRITIEDGREMPKQLKEIVYVNKCTEPLTIDEWKIYREENIPHMDEELNKLPKPTEGNKAVFIFHAPPYGCGLDNCKDGDKVGSNAITQFIKNEEPYMTFHGHIHESPKISGKWYEKIDNTICIQPGQSEYKEPVLNYVIVDTDNNTLEMKIEKINNEFLGHDMFQ